MKPENEIWNDLRRLTAARIGLRRAGASVATRDMLDFQLAHARARDAVHAPLDEAKLAADLAGLGAPVIATASAAGDRQTYLMRPDLGRQLVAGADAALKAHRGDFDVVFVIADGLSARAVALHAQPVLSRAIPALRAGDWKIAPLVIVRYGRVAVGDVVAATLSAECAVVLIGERPGLSAPDSMGAYLTWQPQAQTTDAERNCISNIRPEGIDYESASFKLTHLLRAMRARGLSGVALKDDSDRLLIGEGS
ncbi:MAG TPA: ethanolamine ammonia-lyase subunit EutC [Xanthobacteraceae bacterium]|jgi:ethanolamine ammonia-lyase small subunit|nr:ethanolamine ammonia-lyase subunit EutC [Xanthobacteraceae bacterium]